MWHLFFYLWNARVLYVAFTVLFRFEECRPERQFGHLVYIRQQPPGCSPKGYCLWCCPHRIGNFSSQGIPVVFAVYPGVWGRRRIAQIPKQVLGDPDLAWACLQGSHLCQVEWWSSGSAWALALLPESAPRKKPSASRCFAKLSFV